MIPDSMFLEEKEVAHLNKKVRTPGGWALVTHVVKTVPLIVTVVNTASCSLRCADKHLIRLSSGEYLHAEKLESGMVVDTAYGPEVVTSVGNRRGKETMYDIKVDSEDHVYYASGIASHNSTGLGAASLIKCNLVPRTKMLYIAPHHEQVRTFADRIREMERGSSIPIGGGGRNNQTYKEYLATDSTFKMQHLLTDASPVRGNTSTDISIDEVQDFDLDLEPELLQTMKAAKRPSLMYTGTSTTRDTALEAKYQGSSRGVWHVRSANGKYFALDDMDMLEDIIQPEGLTCPFTGMLVHPSDGEFVHEDRELERIGRVSFHTPQIIVPEYATGDKWLEVYNDFMSYPRPKFIKEVMGVPVDDGNREITEGDLKRMAQEGVSMHGLQKSILEGSKNYRFVISGCDWGGSDYNPALRTKSSFTVHVMLGVLPDGRMECFHFKRYAGMDYSMIAKDIVDNHVRYKGYAIGSDVGMGMYYNKALQSDGRIPASRHIMWNYTQGNFLMQPIKTDGASIYHLALNKTDSLSALFSDFKRDDTQGGPRIVTPKWADVHGYMTDCTNSFRHITEVGARTSVTYKRHGSKADDIMHGINFAVCTARLIMGEPMIQDRKFVEHMRHSMGTTSLGSPGLQQAIAGQVWSGGHQTM